MQNQPFQGAAHTFTVFRLALVSFIIGFVADLSGFALVAGAAVSLGLLISVLCLGLFGLLMLLIQRDRTA